MANKTGMTIIDTFLYGGKKYLDQREYVDTINELKTTNENVIPEGFITYCKENNKRYKYNSTNSDDPLTGKWREIIINDLTTGGTDAALSAEQGKVLKGLIDKKQDTLVSGNNIKTINGTSLLGEGDITISGGTTVTIVNDLTTGGAEQALSAEQGKVLKGLVDTNLNSINSLKSNKLDVTKANEIFQVKLNDDPSSGNFSKVNGVSLLQKGNIIIPKTAVVDNLTSDDTDKALSAYQGKVLKGFIDGKQPKGEYAAKSELATKQNTLIGTEIEGQNIKTINGVSILGTGNLQISSGDPTIVIDGLDSTSTTSALSANQGKVLKGFIDNKQDTLVSGTNIRTINGEIILGEGNLDIPKTEVINDLTSGGIDKALSAEQGKVLNDTINAMTASSEGEGSFVTSVTQKSGKVSVTMGKGQASDVTVDATTAGIKNTNVQGALKELKDSITEQSASSKVTLEFTTPSNVAKRYTIKQGTTDVGTIDIPKDMVVQSGEIVKGTWTGESFSESLTGNDLALKLTIGESNNIYINPKGLVNIYKAGNGLNLNVDTFTAKIDVTSPNYLSVGEQGLKVDLHELNLINPIQNKHYISSISQTNGKINIETKPLSESIGVATVNGVNDYLDVNVTTKGGLVTDVTIDNKDIASAKALQKITNSYFDKDNISITMPEDGVGVDTKVMSEKLTINKLNEKFNSTNISTQLASGTGEDTKVMSEKLIISTYATKADINRVDGGDF